MKEQLTDKQVVRISVEKVVLVPLWHEAEYLTTEQERAALAWTEEVIRVSKTHASDEAYAAALRTFWGEGSGMTLTIAAMKAIHRMGTSVRMKPRASA